MDNEHTFNGHIKDEITFNTHNKTNIRENI